MSTSQLGVYTAGSLKKKTTKNSEMSVGGIHGVKMSVFLLTSVGTPPPGHATSQVPGKSRLL